MLNVIPFARPPAALPVAVESPLVRSLRLQLERAESAVALTTGQAAAGHQARVERLRRTIDAVLANNVRAETA